MTDSLTSKTLRGLNWSYLSTILNAVLQIGFTAVMARLLDPAAFGLVAMAGVVLRFGSYFAQMGVGPALVQKKEISTDDIHVAFTSALLLGCMFFALVWIAAPLALFIFNDANVIAVLRLMAVSFVLTGFSTTSLSLLRRDMEFRSLAIIETSSYLIGYAGVGIVLALNGFGVWSLVIGALCQNAFLAILSYIFQHHSLSMTFRWRHYKPIYAFGSRVSVIGFLESISSNLDTLAIGHYLSANALGVYNRAFMLVNLPMQYFTSSLLKVLLPSFSRIQSEITRLRKAYLFSTTLLAAFLIPACFGVAASSREIVLLVLGDKWSAAVPVLQILALATPFNLLASLGATVCEATATLNVKAVVQACHIAVLGILFYILRAIGILGFATAVVIGECFRQGAYIFVTSRILKMKYGQMLTVYWPGLLSGVIVVMPIYVVAILMRQVQLPISLIFAAELIVGLFVSVFLLSSSLHETMRREIRERFIDSRDAIVGDSIASRMLRYVDRILLARTA